MLFPAFGVSRRGGTPRAASPLTTCASDSSCRKADFRVHNDGIRLPKVIDLWKEPMTDRFPVDEVAQLMRQGGLSISDPENTKYDPSLDPGGAERLASRLADLARALEPSALVIWKNPEDILLAHLVGLALDVHWIAGSEEDGFVAVSGRIVPGSSVVFLTDAVREETPLIALRNAMALHGVALAGTCVLVGTEQLDTAEGVGRKISLIDGRRPS